MKVVSDELYSILLETQKIAELKDFYLTGGTNLALRLQHRKSVDIDLFRDTVIDTKEAGRIYNALDWVFHDRLLDISPLINEEKNLFIIHSWILGTEREHKLDIVSGVQRYFEVEKINKIPFASFYDIAIMKLESMCDRYSIKDAYDLDIITETIPLIDIWKMRKEYNQVPINLRNLKTILRVNQLRIENSPEFPNQKESMKRWKVKVKEFYNWLKQNGIKY